MLVCTCFRMYKILILLSVLAAVISGKSVPLLRPMSQDMIDFINNEAQTTWKVCVLTRGVVVGVQWIDAPINTSEGGVTPLNVPDISVWYSSYNICQKLTHFKTILAC